VANPIQVTAQNQAFINGVAVASIGSMVLLLGNGTYQVTDQHGGISITANNPIKPSVAVAQPNRPQPSGTFPMTVTATNQINGKPEIGSVVTRDSDGRYHVRTQQGTTYDVTENPISNLGSGTAAPALPYPNIVTAQNVNKLCILDNEIVPLGSSWESRGDGGFMVTTPTGKSVEVLVCPVLNTSLQGVQYSPTSGYLYPTPAQGLSVSVTAQNQINGQPQLGSSIQLLSNGLWQITLPDGSVSTSNTRPIK
jgi:hypothetical protein